MKKTIHRFVPLLALAVLACGAIPLRAAPVLIDGFTDDLAPAMSNTFLDGAMLGGEADLLFLEGDGSVEISGDTLALTPSTDGAFGFIYDGDDDLGGNSYGLTGIDLTGGGSNDRIEIALASVSGSLNFQVQIWEDNSNSSNLTMGGVTSPGVLVFPFADFVVTGSGADLSAAKSIAVFVYYENGEAVEIDSITAAGLEVPTDPEDPAAPKSPDTARPAIKFLKKQKLKTPRPRHAVRGRARDNVEVARVKVRVQGKGWRKAKLRPSGRFKFRTPRLKSGNNRIKIRARDTSGNRSKARRVRARGR